MQSAFDLDSKWSAAEIILLRPTNEQSDSKSPAILTSAYLELLFDCLSKNGKHPPGNTASLQTPNFAWLKLPALKPQNPRLRQNDQHQHHSVRGPITFDGRLTDSQSVDFFTQADRVAN